jgi:hypothetical protein
VKRSQVPKIKEGGAFSAFGVNRRIEAIKFGAKLKRMKNWREAKEYLENINKYAEVHWFPQPIATLAHTTYNPVWTGFFYCIDDLLISGQQKYIHSIKIFLDLLDYKN